MIPDFISLPPVADMILPAGIYDVTLDEVEDRFVRSFPDSKSRRTIFNSWLNYRTLVHKLAPVAREYLDGSFVTDKVDPKDADISFWISADDLLALTPTEQTSLATLFQDPVRLAYRCDSYLVPECGIGHPEYASFQKMLWTVGHWKACRDDTRAIVPGAIKGFLRIVE